MSSSIRFAAAALASSFALMACSAESASPGGGDVTDDSDFTASQCTPGPQLKSPGYDDETPLKATYSATHRGAAYIIPDIAGADAATDKFSVLAEGTGDHKGNFQLIDPADYVFCGSRVTMRSRAHLTFSGEGLTKDQMSACAKDMKAEHCATIAHYCKDGTLEVAEGKASRCELKDGAPVKVYIYGEGGPITCTSGEEFAFPGFDDEIETLAEGKKFHKPAGYMIIEKSSADAAKHTLTVTAEGLGAFAGNFQYLEKSSYEVCGGAVKVKPKARIFFGGGGLTDAQLAECAADDTLIHCATIAYYCTSGTLEVRTDAPPSCELKAHVEVTATLGKVTAAL